MFAVNRRLRSSITGLLSKLGFKTCRNGYYKSYATRIIPVRNGKGGRGPPLWFCQEESHQ